MISQTCPQEAGNKAACPCENTTCENFGRCCQCIATHREYGMPVSCMAALAPKK